MAKLRVAINGFGRIGRLTARRILDNRNVELVAINDLTDNATLAHLFKYDTAHNQYPKDVKSTKDSIIIGRKSIKAYAERDPQKLPWKKLKIDVVLESTGVFRDRDGAGKHLKAGAKKVVISAPAKGDIKTIVLGVNQEQLNKKDKIVSNASCTTNCLAPMVKILDSKFGIESGFLTTIHAYTSDQRIQDAPHRDLRRARAAAQNIIPTTTGAAVAVTKVLPHLEGKLTGAAMRVPVINGSITEFTCVVSKEATVEKINKAFLAASKKDFKGILQYSTEPLVSSDIIGNPYSCIFDSEFTKVMGNMVRVLGWYDNEYGYSSRLDDLMQRISKL